MQKNQLYSNFLETLRNDINKKFDILQNEDQAFVRIAAQWLGYAEIEEDEDDRFVDGAGDRGIDFWYESEPGFDIVQVKSHKLAKNGDINTDNYDKTGVIDLQRIVSYLLDEKEIPVKVNKKLHYFRQQWESAINRKKLSSDNISPLQVSLLLVLFGEGLTEPALREYDSFLNTISKPYQYREVPIEFRARFLDINQILDERWKEDNREWRDRSDKRRNYIHLHPMDYKKGKKEISWLTTHNSAIFYCKAIDLITAYNDFGYQIFEPNVRAVVPKSNVNKAIQDSIIHRQTRHEFMYLNNGVTITCTNYHKPSDNTDYFKVIEPGVINGLQTVVALSESYSSLTTAGEREDLETNCYVLVRLLGEKAVSDINRVVIASNTQNPMQARNLKSNNTEQIYYEKLFAEMGWFYARKQGAWDAFFKSPQRWRTLRNYRKENFKIGGLGGRARYRVVDNEAVAQAWLSFIGFSDEAVHQKRYIFDKEIYYSLVFLNRTSRHGIDYNFQISDAKEELISQSPSQTMMLTAYLAREVARYIALTGNENRESAFKRLRIDIGGRSKESIESQLTEDHEYLLEQALSAMTMVFVEALGYILFKALEERVHDVGPSLIINESLKELKDKMDFEKVAKDIRKESTKENDVLAIAWYAFRHIIDQMMASPWRQSYQTARSRTRFNHSKETRERIFKRFDQLDEFMRRSQVTEPWAAGIPSKRGLYKHFKDILWQRS